MAVLKLAHVDDHWPLVFRGLAAIHRKSPESWTMADLADACRAKEAFLFVGPPGFEGFIVLHPRAEGGRKWVHIWAAYGQEEDIRQQYWPQVIGLARQIGAGKLTWGSRRRGYIRYLPGATWNGRHYEVDL